MPALSRDDPDHAAGALERHAVIAYYVMAIGISWAGVMLAAGSPMELVAAELDTGSAQFVVVLLATLAGPPVAAVVMTGITDGRPGIRRLLSRLLTWRVAPRWYALALLVAPLSVTASLLLLSAISAEFTPGYLTGEPAELVGTLTFALAAALLAAPLEELGWTGFATPRMLNRRGVLGVGLIAGLLWGLWHLVSNLLGSDEDAGSLPIPLYLVGILFTFLPPFRVLMVWLYSQTQNLPLAMLMHASLITFWLFSTPEGLSGRDLVAWYMVWGALLWLSVGALVVLGQRAPRAVSADK